jgi:flagellar biosynthesis/type III secretory pathway protein FliH
MQGTIEKSAPLSAAKVVLGHEPAPLPDTSEITAEQPVLTIDTSIPPAQRIAELEALLTDARSQLAEREAQLHEARDNTAASTEELAQLQQGLSTAQNAAEQRGYTDGSAAARADVQTEIDRNGAAWEQGLADLAERHREYGAQLQLAAGDIALAATVKIIGERLVDAEHIGRAIEHIIRESGLGGALKIYVAPTHYDELTRNGSVQRLAGRQIDLQADARVEYGGCLLEASDAAVDGRYEVQLKKLQQIVAEFSNAAEPGK